MMELPPNSNQPDGNPPDSNQDATSDDAEREIATQANAMKDQLRKDVASWSKARHDGAGGLPGGPGADAAPARKPVAAKPAPRTARATAAAAKPATTTPPAPGKPFRMSYSGSSTADYIKYMRDRGAK